jgi:hypothetical protein
MKFFNPSRLLKAFLKVVAFAAAVALSSEPPIAPAVAVEVADGLFFVTAGWF